MRQLGEVAVVVKEGKGYGAEGSWTTEQVWQRGSCWATYLSASKSTIDDSPGQVESWTKRALKSPREVMEEPGGDQLVTGYWAQRAEWQSGGGRVVVALASGRGAAWVAVGVQ